MPLLKSQNLAICAKRMIEMIDVLAKPAYEYKRICSIEEQKERIEKQRGYVVSGFSYH